MKKILLLAASALTLLNSCNKSDRQPDLVTYDLTVEAADCFTKGIAQNGNAIKSVWNASDKVTVYNSSNASIGTLTPQTTGSSSTVLKGTITTSGLNAGTSLRLHAPRPTWLYSGQKGALSSLGNYSYATAEVSVTAVNGTSVTASAAAFSNEQAMVKFTLCDEGGSAVNPDELVIEAASGKLVRSINASLAPMYGSLIIAPDDETNVLWVALRNDSGAADTYTFSATAGKKSYTAQKDGALLEKGKFYTVKLVLKEANDTYTVAGAPASLFGTEWDATNTANDMVKQSDGTFLKTYNVTAVADVAFKVVKNHVWGSAGVNNWPVDDISFTAGIGTLKIMFDPSTKKVSYEAADPGVVTEIFTVAGTPASVFGTEWDPSNTANDMVKQSDGNYTKSYSNVPAGAELQFKVTVNHAWTKSYGYNGGSANVSYTMSKTGTLTVHYDAKTHYVTASEN